MKLSRTFILALLALIAGIFFSCDNEDKPTQLNPPAAPILLAILGYDQTTVEMNWADRSADENGFRIEVKEAGGSWTTDGEVGINVTNYTSTGLTPSTEYSFRVFSFNDRGDSDSSSNVQTITTMSDVLPLEPLLVHGTATGTSTILVTWVKQGEPDSFRIDRRTSVSQWMEVVTIAADTTRYEDFGLTQHTTYYYKVAAINEAGLAWSEESDPVTTPIEGAPYPPSDVIADGVVGFGVTVSWTDNSIDEEGFIIRRNQSGESFQIIDTVDANVTSYYDDLGSVQNTYTYRVRAFNEFGESSDAQSEPVEYEFCSDGIIPLCLSNVWRYAVEEEGHDPYELQRSVARADYLNDIDFYLIIEHPYPVGENPVDSTIYLRNFSGQGCRAVPFPMTGQPSEVLFRDPPGSVGDHYFYRGDSILVLANNGQTEVNGSTMTGLYAYQRFLHGQNRSIRYWIKPYEIGIVKEEEVVSSEFVVIRELISRVINND